MIGWVEFEDWLVGLHLGDVETGGDPAPVLACGDARGPALLVIARPEGDRDGVDAVTELAVAVAAVCPVTAAISVPGRLRPLDAGPDGSRLDRCVVITSARHVRGSLDLRVRSSPIRGDGRGDAWRIGPTTDLEPELSPVASLIEDVVRHPVDHDPVQILSVLTSWGHLVALPRDAVSGPPDLGLPPPTGGARHRAHRHALELARRHQPMGAVATAPRRPALVGGIPAGWEPACPL